MGVRMNGRMRGNTKQKIIVDNALTRISPGNVYLILKSV